MTRKLVFFDDVYAPQGDGSFYATKNGTAYITVDAADSVPITSAMFCDGPVPASHTEGVYNAVWPIRTHTVTVKPSGGDYSNLRTCLEAIKPNANNRYIVEIYEGTYDVKGYYTRRMGGESPVCRACDPGLVTLRWGWQDRHINCRVGHVDRQYIST
jgi:hypothetical protein